MNQELQLKLQAYLDGELSGRKAREVAAWLANDAGAKQLAEELRLTRTALRGQEPQRTVPESREFYWSKIEREIMKSEPAAVSSQPAFWWMLRRWLAPFAGVALVAFLALSIARFSAPMQPNAQLAVVENLSEHVSSLSFRSASEKMSVVWLYDTSQPAVADVEPMDEEAMFFQ